MTKPLMTEQMTRLDNGFLVVTDAVAHVDTVTVGVWVRTGTRDEPAAVNGISHFLEHLAFKGTATKDAFAIAAAIENRGGTIDAYTDYELTAYYVQTGARHLPTAVALLAEVLTESVFPEAEVAREIGVVLQEIDQYADEPEAVLADSLRAAMYPDQPLGRPILGRREVVAGFTRQHLLDHIGRSYAPNRMVLVVSGRAEHTEVVGMAARLFGARPVVDGVAPQPGRYVGGHVVEARDIEQTHFALGFEGLGLRDSDLPALRHAANLLGGGMTSRLFQEVREKRGLAYDVHADIETHADGGILVFEAATSPERRDELVALLNHEIERARLGFDAGELARSWEQVRFMIGMARESTLARAQRLARDVLFWDRVRSFEEVEAEFDAVSLDDLNRVTARVLSGPTTTATVGPVKTRRSSVRGSARRAVPVRSA